MFIEAFSVITQQFRHVSNSNHFNNSNTSFFVVTGGCQSYSNNPITHNYTPVVNHFNTTKAWPRVVFRAWQMMNASTRSANFCPGTRGDGDEKQDLCLWRKHGDSRWFKIWVGTWVNFEWLGLTVNHQQWQGKPSVCRRKNGFNQCKINESMMLGPLKIIVKVRIPLQLSSFSPFK